MTQTVQEIYNEKKEALKELLFENTTYRVDEQPECEQVGVWCETFGENWSICFQNGDMNGKCKGEGVWTNDGADSGLDDLRNILKERPEFQCLIEPDEYWKYEYLKDLIHEFIAEISKREGIDSIISSYEESKIDED